MYKKNFAKQNHKIKESYINRTYKIHFNVDDKSSWVKDGQMDKAHIKHINL